MKIVLDTNVFISGLFWKGPPQKILEAWAQQKFKLAITPSIIEEYRRVLEELSTKFDITIGEKLLNLISIHGEITPDLLLTQKG